MTTNWYKKAEVAKVYDWEPSDEELMEYGLAHIEEWMNDPNEFEKDPEAFRKRYLAGYEDFEMSDEYYRFEGSIVPFLEDQRMSWRDSKDSNGYPYFTAFFDYIHTDNLDPIKMKFPDKVKVSGRIAIPYSVLRKDKTFGNKNDFDFIKVDNIEVTNQRYVPGPYTKSKHWRESSVLNYLQSKLFDKAEKVFQRLKIDSDDDEDDE